MYWRSTGRDRRRRAAQRTPVYPPDSSPEIIIVSGNSQTVAAGGNDYANLLVARCLDDQGDPVSGITVTITALDGGDIVQENPV